MEKSNKFKISLFKNIRVSSIKPASSDFDRNHPLFGKGMVFTGELMTMSRQEAMQSVVNAGAKLTASVQKGTSYLVEGKQDPKIVKDGKNSAKTIRAKELIARGFPIKIIHEADLTRMLEWKAGTAEK